MGVGDYSAAYEILESEPREDLQELERDWWKKQLIQKEA